MPANQIDIQFIDASDWQELAWYNSGGTRAKKVLQDHNGNEFYFKCSEKKPAKDGKPAKHYKYEFWNEIIAYQLGKHLGLNMLQYDVAVFEGEIGCISPKMIVSGDEQLLEMGRFMTAINSDFLPENTKTRTEYTFQLLAQTLEYFKIDKYLPFFFQTLLFDVIIGNTDRHQENWAFIGKNTLVTTSLSMIEAEAKEKGFHKLSWFFRGIYNRVFDKEKNELNELGKQIILETINISKTAPIYDSGSSLARELTDERVEFYLSKEEELKKYVNNGKAELHWKKRKLTHYDLVKELLNSAYAGEVNDAAKFLENWRSDIVTEIVTITDQHIPVKWQEYRIPDNRKKLILKLLTLRFEKLIGLLRDGVR